MSVLDGRWIPEPNSGCWLWTACVNTAGYGIVRYEKQARLAHRISYAEAYGGMPNLHVLHRCDNPSCINPDHLFLGTQADNNADMDRKGRRVNGQLSGVQHPNTKLTPEQVARAKLHIGSATPLAREFGVTPEQINNIRRGAQWRSSRP